jgi:hypothetical protein
LRAREEDVLRAILDTFMVYLSILPLSPSSIYTKMGVRPLSFAQIVELKLTYLHPKEPNEIERPFLI